MDPAFKKQRERLGVLYGLWGGLSFAVLAWLVDAIALASNHAALPFIKFVFGFPLILPVFILVGWLSAKTDKIWISIPLWLLLATWSFYIASIAQYQMMPRFYALNASEVVSFFTPGFPPYFLLRVITIGTIITGLAFLFAGLFENILIDYVLNNDYPISPIIMSLVVIFIMALAASMINDYLYKEPRAAIVGTNRFIVYMKSPEGQALSPKEKTLKNFGAFGMIPQDDFNAERRFYITSYAPTDAFKVDFLAKFGQTWATCTAIRGNPSFCKTFQP